MNGETVKEPEHDPKGDNMFMMRILGPITTFVDRPWKVLYFSLLVLTSSEAAG
jgi:high-affinity nickel-transport protein